MEKDVQILCAQNSNDHVSSGIQQARVSSCAELKLFKDTLTRSEPRVRQDVIVPLQPLAIPRYEGSNLIIELDVEEYKKGIDELKCVVGRNYLQKGKAALTTMELRKNWQTYGVSKSSNLFRWGRFVSYLTKIY